ncbi:MAG TPA: hypothetical protein VLH58_10935 [Candidatus Methylomirabilis sp.]|nr:hypothetical protein [Candidatus Methylomirabilis sp.]
MRTTRWMFILGLVAVVATGGTIQALAASADQTGLTQQVAGGGVMVVATLLKDQAETMAVKLALETHSVNLDGYILENLAVLRDDSGKRYQVQAVEQASGGGHHRLAVLRFGKVRAEARTLELIVKDVAGVKERTFRWALTD